MKAQSATKRGTGTRLSPHGCPSLCPRCLPRCLSRGPSRPPGRPQAVTQGSARPRPVHEEVSGWGAAVTKATDSYLASLSPKTQMSPDYP